MLPVLMEKFHLLLIIHFSLKKPAAVPDIHDDFHRGTGILVLALDSSKAVAVVQSHHSDSGTGSLGAPT